MNSIEIRSAVVVLGAALVAVGMAVILTLATFGRKAFVSQFQAALVNSVILLPSYVVAGAWSAGFGSMGWWTLSQVTAAKAPLVGIASVIWIHGMAATPVAFGLLTLGLRRCSASTVELAKMEGGPKLQFIQGIWPNWSVWCAGVFFLVAAWVSGDMVVTNLFQVSTLTEQCYLDRIADQATWSRTLAACSLSVGLGIVGVAAISRVWNRDRRERQLESWNDASLGSDGLGFLVGGCVVLLVVGVPLANLIIKAGWLATEIDPGTIDRSWSLGVVGKNMLRVPTEFADEFGWSMSLAGWSATAACIVASSRIFFILPRLITSSLFALLLIAFALPGPIVSGWVIALFQLPISGLVWLNDHTLAAPLICLQFRLVPLAVFAFAILERRWQDRVGDVWRIDGDKAWTARIYVYLLSFYKPVCAIWVLLFSIAFGDLSSYLPCLPPGVTPVSMRIFDLLHYGVRTSEASLLLVLTIIGSAIGWFLLVVVPRLR